MVSVVVPAFNEERRLGDTLEAISAYLARCNFSSEVIVVDDGSTDNTSQVAQQSQVRNLRLVRNEINRGKGYTVRRGVETAQGDIILFTDADNSTPIEEFDKFRPLFAEGADGVIGSRALPQSQLEVHQSALREFAGRTFNLILRSIVGLSFHDTQCGFKAFRRQVAREIFPKQTIHGWGFDAEILLIAKRKGFRILETPVRWINSADSRLLIWRDAPRMFMDLVKIRLKDLRGSYK